MEIIMVIKNEQTET